MKIKKPDWKLKEENVAIGCIVSDEFCKLYSRVHDATLLKSRCVEKVVAWSLDYYERYKRSPKRYITRIWKVKREGILDEDEEKEIGKFLASLNNKYKYSIDEFDPEYEFNAAVEYLRARQVEIVSSVADDLIKDNKVVEAERILKDLKPIDSFDLVNKFGESAVFSNKFVEEKLPKPKRLLRPWLNEGSLNMVFSQAGIGKTWLCLSIAVALTRKEWDDIEIGPWEIKNPAGCLYIDGEMGEWGLQERLFKLIGDQKENIKSPLIVISANRLARKTQKQIDLTKQEWREAIYEYIARRRSRIKVLFIDNLSALTPGRDENDKKEWDLINQWLITLRHLGLAVVVVHHSTKGKVEQRGTSAHEDAMDVVISLTKVKKTKGTNLFIYFKKVRNLASGAVEPFQMKLEKIRKRKNDNSPSVRWVEVINEEED